MQRYCINFGLIRRTESQQNHYYMNYLTSIISFTFILIFSVSSVNSQIIITSEGFEFDTIISVNYSVEPTFLGNNYLVSNVDFTGSISAVACFEADSTALGVSNGLLLSTGIANTIIGPNNSEGSSTSLNTTGTSYFPTLDTYDAAVLEFDFTSYVDYLAFRYVFGSEEYLEYVNSGFNDRFGIFLSGPGIVGQKEISTLPNGGGIVGIDNIHSAGANINGDAFPPVNGQYYVNNSGGTIVEFDGYTTPIDISEPLLIGQTYHLVVVISDVGDGVLDSGVFLENCPSCGCEINETVVKTAIKIENDELLCYPNPSQGSFSIQIPSEAIDYASAELIIVDIAGKVLVNQKILDESSTLHISGLSSGMYHVSIQDVNTKWSSKMIVAD